MANNNNFNSTSILDWFKGNLSDYLSIQISGLENAHLDTSPSHVLQNRNVPKYQVY